MPRRPDITWATADELARPVIRRIDIRTEPCRCGCLGSDPWHRASFDRKVRNVVVLEEPRVFASGYMAELATAEAKFPWGIERVHAYIYIRDGVPARIADWRRVEQDYSVGHG